VPYPKFDRSRLNIKPLDKRVHDLELDDFMLPLDAPVPAFDDPNLPELAQRILDARCSDRPVILMMGAHVIRKGMSQMIIDLMERGILTHIALNGAGVIHDFELALIGATTESVARYISSGQFGLWRETGLINDAVAAGAADGLGYGEAVGRWIVEEGFPYREISIVGRAYQLGLPVTVHVGIGQDIIHEHPNFDGAATGAASYTDFLIFTEAITQLEGGVFLNIGTAVMGPEVYLKALAMARNVASQEGREIIDFTTAVFDLVPLNEDIHTEVANSEPVYYFRPYKTILVRTVQDGGESFYIRGDHLVTVPNLYHHIISANSNKKSVIWTQND
jgi:hypothetical protein